MDGQGKRSWSTAVSDVEAADVFIRGYSLGDLIGRLSFSAAAYLLIRGRLPKPGEARMMDAILCSVLDYALKKPGTVAARYCVSANPSMTAGLATAILSVGEYTLAPDDAGRFIAESFAAAGQASGADDTAAAAEIDRLRAAGRRVPGFGHPNFRFTDPRAQKLKSIAQAEGCWGPLCDWYEALHRAFTAKTGKPEIVINEVGMMAAILAQMGFTPAEMTGIALMSSMPGVIAHISEELQSKVRIRTVPDETVEYARPRRELVADLKAAGWTGN
ncbi:citryl-CoA lyase [Hypericibacter adhaerens]|jgi:citrate synthase|uniref:citrate synthase (unknown stereospecificity) n=1 Tax=Hypericibacter adhaerens TaxID=2602016 RepID=A0A5J6N6N8_9PROT|nr:citryl-CoA lyase [Hypericibacter adhaerens]QEX25247.1 citryl-CoA lyase [Hypericibacter adhaerens]